ncbi:hypothetical protein ASG87_00960 [Frateuria sp. Soil773]|nr:hypothetical protein ASG87_00960 [Frateuria sp. Soil773]
MNTVHKILAVLLLTATPLAAFAAMPCKYSEPRNADIDAAGLKRLQMRLGSSDLEIQGVPGLSKVEVRGTACASEAARLKNLQIDTGHSGDQATVDAENRDDGSGFSLFGSDYAYLKLHVRVPAAMAVDVGSGSGDARADGLASLDFHSGSGDLVANRIDGALALQLGSADVKASQVGSVKLRGTGSGDVRIDGVRGDVEAGNSGSGDLSFSNVDGSVSVGHTGSGDITLRRIGRDVEIGGTGSGDVDADGIGGNLRVRSTGSGEVDYRNVKGKVDVPKRHDD